VDEATDPKARRRYQIKLTAVWIWLGLCVADAITVVAIEQYADLILIGLLIVVPYAILAGGAKWWHTQGGFRGWLRG